MAVLFVAETEGHPTDQQKREQDHLGLVSEVSVHGVLSL